MLLAGSGGPAAGGGLLLEARADTGDNQTGTGGGDPGGGENSPPLAEDDSAVVDEDSAPTAIEVLANDLDEGDALAVSSITSPPANGVAEVAPGLDAVTYTPSPDFSGTDSFDYEVQDEHGGSDVATVTISVVAVNDPPAAEDDAAVTVANSPVEIAVLANDMDIDSDHSSLFVLSATEPSGGLATINHADNTITYSPDPGFEGTDQFDYVVSDGELASTGTVAITVEGHTGGAPDAQPQSITVDEDQGTAVVLAAVQNDGGAITFSLTGNPAHGSISDFDPHAGTLTYVPHANYYGDDAFTFVASDGVQNGTEAAVSIHVNEVNDPPVAAGDTAATDNESTVTIDLLANDYDVDHDDTLTITSVGEPAYGSLAPVQGSLSSYTYTPSPGYLGIVSFAYTVADGRGGNATASVIIAVNEPQEDADDDDNDDNYRGNGGSGGNGGGSHQQNYVSQYDGGDGDYNAQPAANAAAEGGAAASGSAASSNGLLGNGGQGQESRPRKVVAFRYPLLDSRDEPAESVAVGEPLKLQYLVGNVQRVEQPYAFIVQVLDSEGVTMEIHVHTGAIAGGDLQNMTHQWQPAEHGVYTVEMLLWDGTGGSPEPLAAPSLDVVRVAKE